MTREEAVRIMQLNKGRMNGSVQAALAVLLPELDAPQRTVLEWRTCKAAGIGYYAKADGDWVPMDEIEHQQEKMCATCAHYVGRTAWSGSCEWRGRTINFTPDSSCGLWEPYDTSNVEKKEGGNG